MRRASEALDPSLSLSSVVSAARRAYCACTVQAPVPRSITGAATGNTHMHISIQMGSSRGALATAARPPVGTCRRECGAAPAGAWRRRAPLHGASRLVLPLVLLSLPALRSHDGDHSGTAQQQCAELAADDAELHALTALALEFPGAHRIELRRFLRKVGGDLATARANYALHEQWRRDFPPERDGPGVAAVPRWMWFEEGLGSGGGAPGGGSSSEDAEQGGTRRLLWVQGAMFDSSAASVDDYVLATSRVLDSALDRASALQIDVYVDTAPYTGMRNEPATRVVRLAAKLASHLNRHYPGRLVKLLIFPVPSWGVYVWHTIKPLLPSRTAAKVDLRATAPEDARAVQARRGNAPLQ